MKKLMKGLFEAIVVGLLAFTGVQAQIQPVLIDNTSGQVVQANVVSNARQGAKLAASLETLVSGTIKGEIIPCALPTPAAGDKYFAKRDALMQKLLAGEFPTEFAVSRLRAEYTHSANTADGVQVVGAMRIIAAPGTTISAAEMRVWCELLGVPGSAISYEYGTLGYTPFRIGVIYGANGARSHITDGAGSLRVNEIVFVGLGQSLNNTIEQVRAAYAAGLNTYKGKWFSQIRQPDTEFTVPPGDYTNLSIELDQFEGAPAPIVVGKSIKNPGKFTWFVWDSPNANGNFAPLDELRGGETLKAPTGTRFFRFSRP